MVIKNFEFTALMFIEHVWNKHTKTSDSYHLYTTLFYFCQNRGMITSLYANITCKLSMIICPVHHEYSLACIEFPVLFSYLKNCNKYLELCELFC